jgi:hypothetical protein
MVGVNSTEDGWNSFLSNALKLNGKSKPEGVKNRWISVDCYDKRSLMQLLMVHVDIPPLAVKSILNIWKQQIQVTQLSSYKMLILPVVRLSRSSMQSYGKWKKHEELKNTLEQAKRLGSEGIITNAASWFYRLVADTETEMKALKGGDLDDFFHLEVEAGRAVILENTECNTILTLTTDWKLRNSDYRIDADGEEDDDEEDDEDEIATIKADLNGPFHMQHKLLKRDFSFIRSGDCNWLLSSCIKSIIVSVKT